MGTIDVKQARLITKYKKPLQQTEGESNSLHFLTNHDNATIVDITPARTATRAEIVTTLLTRF